MIYQDFAGFHRLYSIHKADWYKKHKIWSDKNYISYSGFFHILAEISKLKLRRINGIIDSEMLVKEHFSKNDKTKGLYQYLMLDARECLFKGANRSDIANALVPIIPAAFKLFRNISYSSWDSLQLVTAPRLYEAITLEYPSFSGQDREAYLNSKDAVNWYPTRHFKGIKNPLAISIMFQIWLAHPDRRSQYAITNTEILDEPAKPLIGDIFLD